MTSLAAAREFVLREARLVERRLFSTLFYGASAAGVVRAVRAYQNDDGGLGHALEPDVRSPDSQPLFVGFGLTILAAVDARDDDLLTGCCEFLETVADERGAVPMILPTAAGVPRAEHWVNTRLPPSLQPTIAIAASLHALGFTHRWLERATDYCLAELRSGPEPEVHLLREILRFLDVVDEPTLRDRAAAAVPGADDLKVDPASTDYGLTPIQMAPTPTWARELFPTDQLDAHLDALERAQRDDGGWPLDWDPPSAAARLEWRGQRTLEALQILRAYDRLPQAP
ncbi:MAG TPA: hypothetical protein VEX15_04835 [Nocardioidaceae bacterium]|nr:hypothetical protein [Nocardioidaceae bacterium]